MSSTGDSIHSLEKRRDLLNAAGDFDQAEAVDEQLRELRKKASRERSAERGQELLDRQHGREVRAARRAKMPKDLEKLQASAFALAESLETGSVALAKNLADTRAEYDRACALIERAAGRCEAAGWGYGLLGSVIKALKNAGLGRPGEMLEPDARTPKNLMNEGFAALRGELARAIRAAEKEDQAEAELDAA